MDISRVQVIEKDFWVCWTLRRLFTLCSASQLQPVTFKGGTTLSKVYRLIERFSEDIDISFGHEIFLDSGIGDPYAAETENQKKKRAKMLREKCGTYVSGPVLEALGGEISSLLGPEGWRLQPDRDRMSLRFSYPADFPSEADTPMSDSVKMEFGISEREPNREATIRPYAAEYFSDILTDADTTVVALEAGRTFWEKALIPHEWFHRSSTDPEVLKKPGARSISRHYYDLSRMVKSADVSSWISDHLLREAVVRFKETLFPRAAARYGEARSGGAGVRLVPHRLLEVHLRRDYEHLKEMFLHSDQPTFDQVVEDLAELEAAVNGIEHSTT